MGHSPSSVWFIFAVEEYQCSPQNQCPAKHAMHTSSPELCVLFSAPQSLMKFVSGLPIYYYRIGDLLNAFEVALEADVQEGTQAGMA